MVRRIDAESPVVDFSVVNCLTESGNLRYSDTMSKKTVT